MKSAVTRGVLSCWNVDNLIFNLIFNVDNLIFWSLSFLFLLNSVFATSWT